MQEYHYKMGKILCPECDGEIENVEHVGIIFINGYPATCPNNGKLPYEYEGVSTPILMKGYPPSKKEIVVNGVQQDTRTF